MDTFYQKTISLFLKIIGFVTMTPIVFAFAPDLLAPIFLKIHALDLNRLFIQHWGVVVFCMGLLLFLSAKDEELRKYIVPLVIFEKLFLVSLVFSSFSNPLYAGFIPIAIFDFIASLYLLGYLFWSTK